MEYIVFTLVFIVIILICLIIDQKRNYELEITKKNREISSITSESNFYKNEYEKRKDIVEINYEVTSADEFMPLNKLECKPIYKGKKALIGDYLVCSYTITKRVLESLGFKVSIALSSDELVQKIKNNEKYDIIFTNNIYRDGTGEKCLSILKSIKDFNTPIVIHTITKNAKYHFENELGFDAYIEKPVTQTKLLPILEKLLRTGGEKCYQRHLKLFIY